MHSKHSGYNAVESNWSNHVRVRVESLIYGDASNTFPTFSRIFLLMEFQRVIFSHLFLIGRKSLKEEREKPIFPPLEIPFLECARARVCACVRARGRSSFVIRLRSQHSSPGSHCCHLRIGPESPRPRAHFTSQRELTFRRATNPRTGNDWQPFRSRARISEASTDGNFRETKAISNSPRRLFASTPDKSVPAVGLLTTQSARD